jgi:uroporphyrinogen decarboxylase
MQVSQRGTAPFSVPFRPDAESLLSCIRREGTPSRVHNLELLIDVEVQDEICARYGVDDALDRDAPFFAERRQIALSRFLGYDYICVGPEITDYTLNQNVTSDTAANRREGGRVYMDEHRGPITCWEEFEAYSWPDYARATTRALEWFERNLPDDMCVIAGGAGGYAELLSWLMGYETLCYALFDQRDLVRAISEKIDAINADHMRLCTQFRRVRMVWGSDDMGYRSGLLMSPDDTRELVLAGHRRMAGMAHDAGRLYPLHSCGKLTDIYDELIVDVRIDAKHSFEDTIEDVADVKQSLGDRVALLGGMDVDFLCRAPEAAVRERVRSTLRACMPGGGYCLGTGNTVANYIPLDNYMAMLDEGRRFAG